jgi:hypothetical protein
MGIIRNMPRLLMASLVPRVVSHRIVGSNQTLLGPSLYHPVVAPSAPIDYPGNLHTNVITLPPIIYHQLIPFNQTRLCNLRLRFF